MKKYAPLATLVSVALLGAILLVFDMRNTPTAGTPSPAPAASAAAAPAPAEVAPPTEAAPAPAAPVVAEKAYTGRSAGNEVTVAIAVKDGKAVAYACDGKKVEAWMEGTLTGDQLSLQGRTSSLTATVSDKATLGSITVAGAEWPFAAKGVQAPAGLYQGRGVLKGVLARVGWIVEDNGTVTGVAKVGDVEQTAPPLGAPGAGTVAVGADTLTVSPVGGDATVVPR
jgi:hypothetical protein